MQLKPYLRWTISAFFLAGLTVIKALPAEGIGYFVAVDGDDANPGGRGMPFATFERARDAVRLLRQTGDLPPGGVTISIRGGRYHRSSPFVLSDTDSGTAECPIVYRAYRDEKVRITGGLPISPKAFVPASQYPDADRIPVEARQSVLAVDLRVLGITDLGEFPDKFRGAPAILELFYNNRALPIARWPNEGWVTIAEVIDRGTGEGSGTGTFVYSEDRPAGWDVSRGVWLHGYWCHDWFDEVIRIGSIDLDKKQITLVQRHSYGIGPSHSWNKVPRRYYALNLLEELDSPGEWFLDRKTGILYLWPPTDIAGAEIGVSILAGPIVKLENVRHVDLRGFTFEWSRGSAVSVSGGSHTRILGCTVRNTGGSGIGLSGEDNAVIGCDIYETGSGGISISGGDRASLVPGRNLALNNHIHDFARRQRTYAAGIHLNGVGNRAANNVIHSCPHAGILYGGNDNIIEYNEIFMTCLETGDVGALYTGRDWGTQGNLIRCNFIHHTGGMRGWSMGVYLDDCDSGDTIVGNIFFKVARAAFIGGGRDNVVENNIFVDCSPAVHVDDRGRTRIKWNAGPGESWDLEAKLKRFNYLEPPWSTRYPALASIMDNQPELPLNNVIRRNVCIGGKWLNARGNIVELLQLENNYISDTDPGFRSVANLDFRLKENSVVWQEIPGFQAIPLEKIGNYLDEYRASWPTRTPRCDASWGTASREVRDGVTPKPTFQAVPTSSTIEVNGDIRAEEWRDADAGGTMRIAESLSGDPAEPASTVRIMAGVEALFISVEVTAKAGSKLNVGHQWGSCDAVEVALKNPVGKSGGPLAFRGYCDSEWECSSEAGATSDECRKASVGVAYAANITDGGKWTAEWSLPWSSIGIERTRSAQQIPFNITVRKTGENLWQMWHGTGGYSWDVDKAGFLTIPGR